MQLSKLERKLISAARTHAPDERVPYAFEKRVMAYVRSHPVSLTALWADALWRAAGACLAVVVLVGTVSVFTIKPASPAPGDLALEFEKTMLAALEAEYSR